MKLFSHLCLALFLALSLITYPNPTQQHSGLLSPQYATSLKPSDFSAGPIVISQPGYYILTNDVIFNPSGTDGTGNPFKAALIILSDCVTLDLNTHSIQQSNSFNSSNFKLIQLGGANVFNPEDLNIYNPKHVTVKNGCLNNSQGYGVYGKENNNIYLYDLTICSCNIAGIFLQNLQCSTIQDCCIMGSKQGAGNVYGIFLRDNESTTPEWTSNSLGTSGPSGVTIQDVKICNVTTDNSFNNSDEIINLLCQAHNKLQLPDVIKLQDSITMSLQPLVTALINAVNALILFIDIAKVSPLPCNIDQVIASKAAVQSAISNLLMAIDTLPNPTPADLLLKVAVQAFAACYAIACELINQANSLSDGLTDFINGVQTTDVWHAYGIRITNGNGINLNNCSVSGTSVASSVTDPTRATGIALDKCNSCSLKICSVDSSSVNLGQAIGYSIATQSQGNHLEHCLSTHHTSNDESYGYWLCQSHSQLFEGCQASANKGRFKSKGFYFELCNANQLKECASFSHCCALCIASVASQTIGFDSVGGDCNIFDTCQSYNLVADKDFSNNTFQPNLLASGFRLRSYPDSNEMLVKQDINSVIINSSSRCHEGSAGNSVGILLDGAFCSSIRKNIVATTRSLVQSGGAIGGNGYGIYDTAADTTALIVENTAYANQTLNYKVSYTLENERLPVVSSTYGDMTSVFVASSWQNISLHANPGSTGCNPECMPNPEQPVV